MRELGHTLGIRTLAELREAAAAGKLDSVPGIGPKTAARIKSGLAELSTARPRRGMPLHRARALVGEIAEALGGEPAGDPRRACDLSTHFAVVVPSNRLLLGVESLPQIVGVLEQDDRRVVGVTAEGYPIEVIAARAGAVRNRARARDRLAGVRRLARRPARCGHGGACVHMHQPSVSAT